MEAHLLLARCMRQWRQAVAERQHVERGRRMDRLLKTLTARENQSRGHAVAEATTESPLQLKPLPRAECPDSPKQHTPPTPLPQPRRPTLKNGGGCGGAVRLGEPALLDASGRPARRGGRCEARCGGSGEAEPPGTACSGEADEEGSAGTTSTCRAASAMLGLSWRANSSRAPPRPASLSPAATAAVPRTAAATVDADADDACAIRGACSLASAFEAAATEPPEPPPAGASADHDGSALELGLAALRRLVNASPSGGSSSGGGRVSLGSRVSEPESGRQAASPAAPSSPPPSSPPPSSPPPSSPPPPSCPPTAIRPPHDRARVPADCGAAAATATAVAAEGVGAGAGAGVGVGAGVGANAGRDAPMGRRGEGALLANRLQVRADERRSRRLEMQRKQQQAQQASKAAAAAAEALQAAREAAARRERAAEVRAEREATERKRELLVYRAKQARQPRAPTLLHSHLRPDPPQPRPTPGLVSEDPKTQDLTMAAVPRRDAGATRRPARPARTSRTPRLASLARPGARGGLQTARPVTACHPKPPVMTRQIPSAPSERLT